MSLDYGNVATQAATRGGDIFAGDFPNMEVTKITIANNAAYDLERGTMLGKITSGGQYAPYNTDKSDGTETFVGILAEDADATSADVDTYMYTTGEFDADKVCKFAGATTMAATTLNLDGIYNSGSLIIKDVEY